jgi:hypothetical protein
MNIQHLPTELLVEVLSFVYSTETLTISKEINKVFLQNVGIISSRFIVSPTIPVEIFKIYKKSTFWILANDETDHNFFDFVSGVVCLEFSPFIQSQMERRENISHLSFRVFDWSVQLPKCQNITSLSFRLGCQALYDYSQFFSSFPNLRKLSIEGKFKNKKWYSELDTFSIPTLQDLEVRNVRFHRFIVEKQFPKLRTLVWKRCIFESFVYEGSYNCFATKKDYTENLFNEMFGKVEPFFEQVDIICNNETVRHFTSTSPTIQNVEQ